MRQSKTLNEVLLRDLLDFSLLKIFRGLRRL